MGSPTPTPWHVDESGDGNIRRGCSRELIARVYHTAYAEDQFANVALIVKGVNSHERLLMELNACRVYVEEAIKLASDRRSPNTMMLDRLRSVSEAIALAEGSTPDAPTEVK